MNYYENYTQTSTAVNDNKQKVARIENYNLLVDIVSEVAKEILQLPMIKFPLNFRDNLNHDCRDDIYLLDDGSITQFIHDKSDNFTLIHACDSDIDIICPKVQLLYNMCNCIIWKAFNLGIPRLKTADWYGRLDKLQKDISRTVWR